MAKSKETDIIDENPFAGFNVLDMRNETKPTIPKKETIEDSNEEEEKVDLEELEKKIKADNTALRTKKETPEKTEEETEDTEEEAEIVNKNTQTGNNSEDFSYRPLVDHLLNKGILDIEEDDLKDQDFSQDEILEKVVGKTIESSIKKKIDSYPDGVKKLIEWVDNGGDEQQFYDYFFNQVKYSDISFKEDDSELQKAILRDALKADGGEDEEIEARIEKYELGGILYDEASVGLKKLQKMETKRDQDIIAKNREEAESRKASEKKQWEELKESVFSKEEVKGFKLAPKIKEKLWEHMTKAVNKSGETQLMINNKTNKDSQLLYAYLDMLNWDLGKLEKSVKTKVTSDLRKNLGRFSDSRKGTTEGGYRSDIDKQEDNPFAGFRKINT